MTNFHEMRTGGTVRLTAEAMRILNFIAGREKHAFSMALEADDNVRAAISNHPPKATGKDFSNAIYDMAVRYLGKEAVHEICTGLPSHELTSGMSNIRIRTLDGNRPSSWKADLPQVIRDLKGPVKPDPSTRFIGEGQ